MCFHYTEMNTIMNNRPIYIFILIKNPIPRLCLLRCARAKAFARSRASKILSVRAIYRASRQVVPRVFRLLINELATRYQQSFNS